MSWDSESPSGTDWDATTPASHGHSATNSPLPELSSAPLQWLYLGIATAVIGLALPLLSDSNKLAAVGWLLGGTVSILLLGVFIHLDAQRRARGWAKREPAVGPLRVALLVVAAAAVATNAWVIADAVARQQW